MESKDKKFDDLKFVRIIQPEIIRMIPRRLFEQFEDMDEKMIERVYEFGRLSVGNPLSILYTLIDDKHVVHGVLWANIDLICGVLWVKLFSVDKEYQTGSIKGATEFLWKKIQGSQITRIECQAGRPKTYERAGWKKSKQVHLEYIVNRDGEDNDIVGKQE